MSGIACVVGYPESGRDFGSELAGPMLHESGSVFGTSSVASLRTTAAWVGRSARVCERMSARSADGNTTLILNGAIHLGQAPSELQGVEERSDTAIAAFVLRLYERHGDAFVDQLNGWFSGVLIDERRKVVLLFNDRYGLGRLYFHCSRDGLIAASEAKVILRHCPAVRALCSRGLAETFVCGSVLQNRTLFDGIGLLPPGSLWTIRADGSIERRSYFQASDWEGQDPLPPAAYNEALKTAWQRLLPAYLRSDDRVGMSLTGGLDGRMIMAWANTPKGDLPCYTFVGPFRRPADSLIAERIAQACGQPHVDLKIENDFFRQFPALAERTVNISDGTMDVSGAVELYANRLAAEIAPVRLTGNYGSEILRRHAALRPNKLAWGFLSGDAQSDIQSAVATLEVERACHPLTFVAFKQVPWHHYARLSVECSQLDVRSPFLDNELVKLAYCAPPDAAASTEACQELIRAGNPALASIPTDRGYRLDGEGWSDVLPRAWSEFTVKLEYLYDYGMPQGLVDADRRLRRLRLERMVLGRHKFYHFRVWYRDQLGSYLKEVLLDRKSLARSYLKAGALETIVEQHISGKANWTAQLHRLLTLELVQRRFVDGNGYRD